MVGKEAKKPIFRRNLNNVWHDQYKPAIAFLTKSFSRKFTGLFWQCLPAQLLTAFVMLIEYIVRNGGRNKIYLGFISVKRFNFGKGLFWGEGELRFENRLKLHTRSILINLVCCCCVRVAEILYFGKRKTEHAAMVEKSKSKGTLQLHKHIQLTTENIKVRKANPILPNCNSVSSLLWFVYLVRWLSP